MTVTAPEPEARIEDRLGARVAVTRIEAGLLPAAVRITIHATHGPEARWWSAYAFGPDAAVPGYEHPTVEHDPRDGLTGPDLWAADIAIDYAHELAHRLEGPRR